jgi:phosphate transport system substrate-binding protein
MQAVVPGDYRLGDYRLIATLGSGGMAEVFLAVRSGMEGFHKLVVIKRLRTDLANQPHAGKYRTLMLDEARLAARLSHPNIVHTFEVGENQGHPFLAMEYLDGQPLSRVLMAARRADRPLPTELALQVVVDVLGALAYAHDLADYDGQPLDIVHRDVSPQNIFWTYDGVIKLVDFGVAKFARSTDETEAGVVKGKLTYMAPEQARGQAIDRRADLFVVGIVMWELLSGRRLLRAPSQAASMQRLLFEDLPSLARVVPGIAPEIADICDRALARDRDHRYATASEMRADLERVLATRTQTRRDNLAAFIEPMFAEERAQMTAHIRDALAGTASAGGELLSLALPELTSTSKTIDIRQTSPSIAEPAQSLIELTPPPNRRRRRWLVGLAAAIAAVIVADLALLREPHPTSSTAPAAALVVSAAAGAAGAARTAPAAPVAEPALRLCGSNTVGAELAPALVEAFLKRKGAQVVARQAEPEHTVLSTQLSTGPLTVDIRAAGTATGFEGLAASKCDLGMASRAINDKELHKLIDAGLGDIRTSATEHVIALDGIAVIVHPTNPLAALDRGQLHDIFIGKITNWSQVGGAAGPITVLSRDNKSGTFDTFKNLVLAGGELAAGARRFADSDQLADAVASDPSAIGFIGLAYVRAAKALAIGDAGAAAMMPSSFTVTTENYMLARRLYLYATPKPRTPLATELVSFVLSPQGQAVVRDTNFVDLSVAIHDGIPCDARCPHAYAQLTASAQRISLDFRFRTASDDVDSRAARDLDRVVLFLRGYPTAKLLLFGFSDAAGLPANNLKLSQRRATTIAHELEMRGIHAATASGFGAAMPVTANDNEADRQRNRRVEAWLVQGK